MAKLVQITNEPFRKVCFRKVSDTFSKVDVLELVAECCRQCRGVKHSFSFGFFHAIVDGNMNVGHLFKCGQCVACSMNQTSAFQNKTLRWCCGFSGEHHKFREMRHQRGRRV